MEIYLGYVSEIKDDKKFIIKFTTKNVIENAIAYPIDTFDELNIGDPVIVYSIESIFGWSFLYKKLRLKDHTRLKLLSSMIDIWDDHIEIHSGGSSEGRPGDSSESSIIIDNSGSITIKSSKEITVESPKIITKGEDSVNIETKSCTIKGDNINITGGNLTTTNGGNVTPDPSGGGFNCIPTCPLTGAPHRGKTISGT